MKITLSILDIVLIGSSGQFESEGVPPGDYVLRIVARDPSNPQDKIVLRNTVSIPKDDEFCVVGLWNRGLTVSGNSATIEFYNVGVATHFQCVLDRTNINEDCKDPDYIRINSIVDRSKISVTICLFLKVKCCYCTMHNIICDRI